MHQYRILSKRGEGTFSEVMRAVNLFTNKQVAIKCMKKKFASIDQVNKLFEIQALRKLIGHPHIVQLQEVLFENNRLAIVFELMDMNVYEAIKDRRSFLPEGKVTRWMCELFEAIQFIHQKQIFHRDVKPENLLIVDDVLKLADLGSCCALNAQHPYTEYISTRWYRAPECLMTSGFYSSKMDIWASGCVLYELVTLTPLFPGKTEIDQIHRIHAVLGTPSVATLKGYEKLRGHHLDDVSFPQRKGTGIAKKLAHCSAELVSFLTDLLTYDPVRRPTASQALRSPFLSKFRKEHPDLKDLKVINSPASTSAPSSPPILPILPPLPLVGKEGLSSNASWNTPRMKTKFVSGVAETSLNSARFRYLSHSFSRTKLINPPLLASARNFPVTLNK